MNRGKISFGKIGLSLGGAKPTVEPPAATTSDSVEEQTTGAHSGFGSFGKIQLGKNDKADKDENKGK